MQGDYTIKLIKNAIGIFFGQYRSTFNKDCLINCFIYLTLSVLLSFSLCDVALADSGLNFSAENYAASSAPWVPFNPSYEFQSGTYSNSDNVSGGNVNINTGNSNWRIYGGWTSNVHENAFNNSVIMTSGNAFLIHGGHVNDSYGDAIGNIVIISGGNVTDNVIGGFSKEGNANNNITIMSGGKANAVYGGNTDVSTSASKAIGNIVIFSGGTISRFLVGGKATGESSNNTLINIGEREIGEHLEYFQNYNFVLDSHQNGSLKVGQTYRMEPYTNKIGLIALAGGSTPKIGDTLTLIKANRIQTRVPGGGYVTGPGPLSVAGPGKKGATLLFDYQTSIQGPNLTATITNVYPIPQAKTLPESMAANAAFINIGADTVAGAGITSALAATTKNNTIGTTSITPFGTIQAGSSQFETGSHIDISGINIIAGLALSQHTEIGKFIIGPFFEAGFGSYNTYNSFDNAASATGDGKTHFLGGGILTRFDSNDTALGRFYLEGSYRLGHAFNFYNTDALSDFYGNKADYDTNAPYHSFHAGLGYIFNLTEINHLDIYGKYFWSHLGGSSVGVLGDPIEFDDIYSKRLRFGVRYSHDFITGNDYSISPYFGIAYEREFDGKARTTTYGYDINAPSLTGNSAMGELGLTINHQNGLSLDFGLSGFIGKRKGIIGSLMLKYEF